MAVVGWLVTGAVFTAPYLSGDEDHPCVAMEVSESSEVALIANLTDYQNILDAVIDIPQGTVFTAAFSARIRSTIQYARAKVWTYRELEPLLQHGSCRSFGVCDPVVLKQIRDQLFASGDTPPSVFEFVKNLDWD